MEQHNLSNYKHRHAKHEMDEKKATRFYNYEKKRKF